MFKIKFSKHFTLLSCKNYECSQMNLLPTHLTFKVETIKWNVISSKMSKIIMALCEQVEDSHSEYGNWRQILKICKAVTQDSVSMQ
jgi:hypothetical protein